MQVKHSIDKTQATITITADEKDLKPVKEKVLSQFRGRVKIQGFRQGKAPLNLVEKNVDQNMLQQEFLEEAVSALYAKSVQELKLRVVSQPQVQLAKFVPFTSLEFTATVPVVGEVKLGDYKKLSAKKVDSKVEAKDVTEVIKSLQTRMAEKTDVDRKSKDGDQVWIDFVGKDSKGEPVKGADGKDYPLLLGSNTFIPGFEPELIGLKAGDEKSFTTTFPKDYRVADMAGKKVNFTCKINKVQEVKEPKVDDAFAKQAGPFESVAELKADIKKHLQSEREQESQRNYESALIKDLTDKSSIEVPEVLVDDETERIYSQLKQDVVRRGQTIKEYLEQEGKNEEEYKKEVLRPQAENRVKAGLLLSEVAEAEDLRVENAELEVRITQLKAQYQDDKMRAELDKPENRREIASRLLTEKTIAKVVELNSK